MKIILIKILKNILFLLLIIGVIDILFGIIVTFALYNSPDGRYYKAIQSLDKSTADILIIGSSKAETNFMPKIFEDELNLSCWNSGRGGQSLPFFRCIGEATLKRYTPKILILNLGAFRLEAKLDKENYSFLKPFYWRHPEIRPFLDRKSSYEKYFMYSSLYRYNSVFYYLFRTYIRLGIDGDINMKGMKPRIGEMKLDTRVNYQKVLQRVNNPLLTEAKNELESLIKSFYNTGTEIYVVISPDFQPSDNTPSIDFYKKFAIKYDFEIFDFTRDSDLIYKPELFKDFGHLNIEGAKLLSNKVAEKIKNREYKD